MKYDLKTELDWNGVNEPSKSYIYELLKNNITNPGEIKVNHEDREVEVLNFGKIKYEYDKKYLDGSFEGLNNEFIFKMNDNSFFLRYETRDGIYEYNAHLNIKDKYPLNGYLDFYDNDAKKYIKSLNDSELDNISYEQGLRKYGIVPDRKIEDFRLEIKGRFSKSYEATIRLYEKAGLELSRFRTYPQIINNYKEKSLKLK